MTWIVELPLATYPVNLRADLAGDGRYSFDTAGALMWLSQLAYESDENIDTILQRWQLVRAAPLHSPPEGFAAARGFVAAGWGGTIVALAGTDPLVPKNWLTDFDVLKVNDVLGGFEK